MIRVLALLFALMSPAGAETARVTSGEHADFTRLVVELPDEGGWMVGRTAMGYAFAAAGSVQPDYDLATVWQRIPRSRLQALRIDPESGTLHLSLACACHVFPFEYQPGKVDHDNREWAAPPGSIFETTFTPGAPPVARAPIAEAAKGYEWLDLAQGPQIVEPADGLPLGFSTEPVSLDSLRDQLLMQISRGAADGVVDMELSGKPDEPNAGALADLAGLRIGIGELPGLAVVDGSEDAGDRQQDGGACFSADTLSLTEWGGGRPVLDLLAEARGGMYGEFDAVAPEAVLRSVRLHLYLGFGAEALQYASLLPTPGPADDLAPLLSIARILEGEADPTTPFAPMLGCDGPAALWAALAHTRLPAGSVVNTDAIVRSFLALPPHLRRHLGSGLADRLLDRDAEAARMIRDAMERTPEVSGGEVALLDAKADLHADRPDDALAHAEVALAEGQPDREDLITLVEAHFQSSLPLAPEIAEDLQSRQGETEPGGQPHRALVLALALSGQIDEAFALAEPEGRETADLWRVVAERAQDSAFLNHAVIAPDTAAPPTDPEVALAVADRLAVLGFPDAALAWLGPVGPADNANRRQIAAAAELARRDAGRALALLAGLEAPEAARLRAAAHTQLGALDAARAAHEEAGQPDEAARLAIWNAEWTRLQAEGPDPWAKAAAFARLPVPPQDAGPLARGAALLQDSAAARTAISTLLAGVSTPKP